MLIAQNINNIKSLSLEKFGLVIERFYSQNKLDTVVPSKLANRLDFKQDVVGRSSQKLQQFGSQLGLSSCHSRWRSNSKYRIRIMEP